MNEMTWQERMHEVLVEGNLIAASTGNALGGTIHAGQVRTGAIRGAYSMRPLCVDYRKANGEELAAHADCRYPMLSRGFPYSFAEILSGKTNSRPCKHCVAVFLAEGLGMPIVEYVRLSQQLNRAAKHGEATP